MNQDKNISNITGDTGKGDTILSEKEEILSRKYFLKGKQIGISISESDNLEELGYNIAHLKDAMIEIARYIIASGGSVAYGGDMRQGGFTELLFDLLAYYKTDAEIEPSERFQSYLAYPISTTLTKEKEAELKQIVTFKKVAPPEDLHVANPEAFLKPNSPKNLYVWTRCLTKMREEMEVQCHARIFIGGRTSGYKGKCPGILEEFLIAIKHNHPVYLIGAFGGITSEIINVLKNEVAESFTNEYHLENAEYKKMFESYNQKHPDNIIDYDQYRSIIQDIGVKGISDLNGLTEDENLRLATTPHVSEIVFLILKGLTRYFAS